MAEVDKFVGCYPQSNVLEVGKLGSGLGEAVLRAWMKRINRKLTNPQVN